MSADQYLLLSACVLGAVACLGWVRAVRRARKIYEGGVRLILRANERAVTAEQACEELRKQVMRGACIVKVPRHSTNAQADLLLEVVAIEGAYHAFTDSPLPTARELYDKLVSTQQIQPLPPIKP